MKQGGVPPRRVTPSDQPRSSKKNSEESSLLAGLSGNAGRRAGVSSPAAPWYNDSRIEGPMSENSMAIGPCDELHVGNRRNEMFCDESLRQADDVVARY